MQTVIQTISEASLRWLTVAAVNRIADAPAAEALTGATALHQLLRGTTAGPEAHLLLTHLGKAAAATAALTAALDAPAPGRFPDSPA
jgi:hypothetical protein